MDEKSYKMGQKQAYTRILKECLRELSEDVEKSVHRLASLEAERLAVVITLRELCEDFGDNDWPDTLHLSDVIEKHLARYLYQSSS